MLQVFISLQSYFIQTWQVRLFITLIFNFSSDSSFDCSFLIFNPKYHFLTPNNPSWLTSYPKTNTVYQFFSLRLNMEAYWYSCRMTFVINHINRWTGISICFLDVYKWLHFCVNIGVLIRLLTYIFG